MHRLAVVGALAIALALGCVRGAYGTTDGTDTRRPSPEAVDACERFSAAKCAREARCGGGLSEKECRADLRSAGLQCERAVGFSSSLLRAALGGQR